jgi:hypothetical protein
MLLRGPCALWNVLGMQMQMHPLTAMKAFLAVLTVMCSDTRQFVCISRSL